MAVIGGHPVAAPLRGRARAGRSYPLMLVNPARSHIGSNAYPWHRELTTRLPAAAD
jgi:hypothetical protein